MAIVKSFAGRNIRKPGAYSESRVDNSGGSDIQSNDTIFIIGESEKGAPGKDEGIQAYSASQLNVLIAKYGSGPLVDCANAAVKPSRTPGISGAGRILVWKTNASVQAALAVRNESDTADLYDIKDAAYGAEGNDVSITIGSGSSARQKSIKVSKLGERDEELGENAADVAVTIQYTGDASTAVAAITGTAQNNKVLAITLAGDQTDGSADLSINLREYSLKGLADFISGVAGYSATLATNSSAARSGNELDAVSGIDVKTAASSFYRLQAEILALFGESQRIVVSLGSTVSEGVPEEITGKFLTGGAKGASTNSDFSNGLAQSLAEDYNVALPAISSDASEDIAEDLTDTGSTYDIASVAAALDAHLRVREDVENRKEAQGMAGVRKQAKADAFTAAKQLGSELVQLAIQDVQVVNAFGSLEWQRPHVQAAQFAGIRLGTSVGEPMTFKRIAANAVGHFVDAATGISQGDFNSDLDRNQAIDSGVTFTEKSGTINRVVVDNTTYGVDGSFVFNRGSVVEASQFIAKDIRGVAEEVFIGQKVSNGAADSIKNVIRNRLIELNQPDVNITTASADAPQGFVEETFVVEVEGNTARVQVEVKPVQGLDFIFITFTLGDISQAA
jgi:hypothetical protein